MPNKYNDMTDAEILQAVRELEADLARLKQERKTQDRRVAPLIRKLTDWKQFIGR